MSHIIKKLDAVFYRTESGVEPVREWLKNLSKQDRRIIGEDILTIQYGWPLGKPLVDNLTTGLWEIRTKISGGNNARIIFFINNHTLVLTSGFIKKTQKTPKSELALAKKRKRSYESNNT